MGSEAQTRRALGPSAWAWLATSAGCAVVFFALMLLVPLTAPAFHPGFVGPDFGIAWAVILVIDIVLGIFGFWRFTSKVQVEQFAGYTTVPFAGGDLDLRDHRTFEIIRAAGVDPLSRRVSLRLGPEKRRAEQWRDQ